MVMLNDTEVDFKDVDVSFRPDIPVAAAGQNSNLPDVDLSLAAGEGILTLESINTATGKSSPVPLTLVATDGGFRVRCKVLPSHRLLEIVLATTMVDDSFKKFDVKRIEITDRKTKRISHNWYIYTADAKDVAEVYNKSRPKTVEVNGRYIVEDEEQTISAKIETKDLLGEFLRQRLRLH